MEIRLENVSKNYGKNRVFQNLSFDFIDSKIYGLVGPNGIGKTTLFKCMLGLLECDSGMIHINKGQVSREKRESVVSNISYLITTGLIPHLSGWDNLKLFADLYETESEQVNRLLHEFDLSNAKRKKVRNYSLGMKQRLALIISLINLHRKIIILDEPYLGLDPIGIQILNRKLLSLKTEGYLIIVSNHQLHESGKIFDEVLFMTSNALIHADLHTKQEDLSELFQKIYVGGNC